MEARPLVQGGMGVGVSAHRLAGAVAREACVGTVSSVDLRRHHSDLMRATGRSRDKPAIEKANLVALDREIRAAKELSRGEGMVAVNVMRAVSQYADYVRQSCASGADAIVVGAGLALDLPELAADWPRVALVPIVSEARAAALRGDVDRGLFFRGSEALPFGPHTQPVSKLVAHLLGGTTPPKSGPQA
jgi:nitronate monooxygenase